MNKEELIVKARTAILKGEKRVDEYYIYTSKIDLDVKLENTAEIMVWEATRRAIIQFYGGIIVDVNSTETERGFHTIINWMINMKFDDYKQNFMQLLLGDDIIRYKINARRIEKGISFEKANILFSKVLERYPHEESRLKVALERIVGEIK